MDALQAAVDELQAPLDNDLKTVSEYRALLTKAEDTIAATTAGFKTRRSALHKVEAALAAAEKDVAKSKDARAAERLSQLRQRVRDQRSAVKEIATTSSSTGSLFVRLFLGRVNVRVALRKDKLQLRDEYNKFKYRANILFFTLPCVAFALKSGLQFTPFALKYSEWITILSHIWLLYYYISLALRENILRVNGSNIRPWWIYHHYISAVMSVVMLTWPKTDTRDSFSHLFLQYFLYQGFTQIVQSRYQSRRHYALRSLGLVSSMDVSSTETLTEMHSGLYVVLMFVGVAQSFQLYIGMRLLRCFADLEKSSAWWEYQEEVQLLILGLSFVLLAVCNFWTTLMTVVDKRKRAALRGSERNIAKGPWGSMDKKDQ